MVSSSYRRALYTTERVGKNQLKGLFIMMVMVVMMLMIMLAMMVVVAMMTMLMA